MKQHRFLLEVLSVLLLCSAAHAQTVDLEQILAYDASAPLDVKVVGTERQGGVKVEDITFASTAGGAPIQAYVVRPEGGAGNGWNRSRITIKGIGLKEGRCRPGRQLCCSPRF